VQRLAALTPEDIAEVVTRPPDAWGVTQSERRALASYLYDRRVDVVKACG